MAFGHDRFRKIFHLEKIPDRFPRPVAGNLFLFLELHDLQHHADRRLGAFPLSLFNGGKYGG